MLSIERWSKAVNGLSLVQSSVERGKTLFDYVTFKRGRVLIFVGFRDMLRESAFIVSILNATHVFFKSDRRRTTSLANIKVLADVTGKFIN